MGKIDDLFFGQISLTSSVISSIIDIGLLPNYDRFLEDWKEMKYSFHYKGGCPQY